MPTRKTTTTRKAGTTATKSKTKSKAAAAKSTKKSAATPRKTATTKRTAKKVSDEEVTIDRRRAPRREPQAEAPAPQLERRKKVQRRRQIDPTTCERDYSEQEVAFMNALDDYKRKSGRMFPTCSEVLEVIRGLGYVQLTPAQRAQLTTDDQSGLEEPTSWSPVEEEETLEDELV